MTSGQEMERVYSYNPEARMGHQQQNHVGHARSKLNLWRTSITGLHGVWVGVCGNPAGTHGIRVHAVREPYGQKGFWWSRLQLLL